MIVHFDSKELLERNYQCISDKGDKAPKQINQVMSNLADQPIQVDISKEGMEAYKKMYQKEQQGNLYGLNIEITSNGLVFGNEDWPDMADFIDLGGSSPEKMLRKGMDMQKWYDDWTSVKDKASMLLSAYAKAYDEICQGYENGTRVRYKIDMSAKELYREVTMEEELEALRERYEARANNLEELHRLSCSARKGISETHSQWAEIGFISREEAERTKENYLKMRGEEKIVDIRQKLIDAASLFVSRYQDSGLKKPGNPIL